MSQDGTENTQDVNTSGDDKGTSEKETETFTRADVEAKVSKARNDALADLNRYKAEAERARKASDAALQRVQDMISEQEGRELDAIRDDPDALKSAKERQRQRAKEADLARKELELNLREEKAKDYEAREAQSTKERNTREVASRLYVNEDDLISLTKFTDGSIEAIEAIAHKLPKVNVKEPLKTDTGKTAGGGKGRKPSLEELQISSPFETKKKVDSGEWVL